MASLSAQVFQQDNGNNCGAYMVAFLCGAACLVHENFTFEDQWYQAMDQLDHRSRTAIPGTYGFLVMEGEPALVLPWRYRLFEVILALAKIKYFCEHYSD